MNKICDRVLLIGTATAIIAVSMFFLHIDKQDNTSISVEPVEPITIVYRPTNDVHSTATNNEDNHKLHNDALRVIHKYYGKDSKISILYIDAAKSFIEFQIDGVKFGGDGSYVSIADMYASLCRLNNKQIILHAINDRLGLSTMDYHSIEVFRGNRKPRYWDEEKEELWGYDPEVPWKRNRDSYGTGLVSEEDIDYETKRVHAIMSERGLFPIKQEVQQGVAPYAAQGAASGER